MTFHLTLDEGDAMRVGTVTVAIVVGVWCLYKLYFISLTLTVLDLTWSTLLLLASRQGFCLLLFYLHHDRNQFK